MEAVGRLAGGIAHDFNNVLSVILSYSETILDDLTPNDSNPRGGHEIRKAAVRAADLTRQLLAFSRQQIVEPRVLDLNTLLAGMDKMLKRILGEDIDLVSSPSAQLGRIRADPSQVEQVIMNLVVNARDAMPTGGHLTIETGNVDLDADYAHEHFGCEPGPHVMIAVSDTGIGMDKATQTRLFEPFFTTKEEGKGTGLGLSTVFGIVQQCGRQRVGVQRARPGNHLQGVFPTRRRHRRASASVSSSRDPSRPLKRSCLSRTRSRSGSSPRLSSNETAIVSSWLRARGDALLLCEKHRGVIELLLTDVVMPQMSGAELAKRIVATRPGNEGAVHVGLHGRQHRAPWRAGERNRIPSEALHAGIADKEGARGTRRSAEGAVMSDGRRFGQVTTSYLQQEQHSERPAKTDGDERHPSGIPSDDHSRVRRSAGADYGESDR